MSENGKSRGTVSTGEKLSYAIASGGGNIVTQMLGTFLTAFLTDSVGIAAATVGTMMLVARIFDGVTDIVMGGVIDKTKTKWGKARPWILVSAPLMCIALIIVFSESGNMGETAKIVYAYISYIFLNCICFTIFMVSHTAMLSRITFDGYERQKMTSLNQIFNQFGSLFVTTFMAGMVVKLGWQLTAAVYGIVTIFVFSLDFSL